MAEILNNYFLTFMHPFKTNAALRLIRVGSSTPTLQMVDGDEQSADHCLTTVPTFPEAVIISWFFKIVQAIYSLVALHLGIIAYNLATEHFNITVIKQFSFMALLFKILFVQVLLFPVGIWIYAVIWGAVIRFFAHLFMYQGDRQMVSEEIVNNSLTVHPLLLIPVFGEFLKHIGSLVYLFAGLRNNMGFTALQSMTVVLAPFVFALFLISFLLLLALSMITLF